MKRLIFLAGALLTLSNGVHGDETRTHRLREMSSETIYRDQVSIEEEAYDEGNFWGRHLGDSMSMPPMGPPPTDPPTTSPTKGTTNPPTAAKVFTLVVTDGSGDSDYSEGTVVEIIADTPPEFKVFKEWKVISGKPKLEDKKSATTDLTMPGRDVVVRATYKEAPSSPEIHTLIVTDGSGDSDNKEGAVVVIVADTPPDFKVFKEWLIVSGEPLIEDVQSPTTNLMMPDTDVVVRATYTETTPVEDTTYILIVTNGSGGGLYPEGTVVDIVANVAPDSTVFKEWVIDNGSPTIEDSLAPTTKLTMPAEGVIIKAVYEELNGCGTTDKVRTSAIMKIVKGVSGKKKFNDENSPQSKAASWLIEDDEFLVCPGVNDKKLIQRYVMAVFYFSSEGDDWLECFAGDDNCGSTMNDFEGKQAYLSPVNECEWAGSKECNEDLCLVDITFEENNNVKGTMPTEFGELDALEVISLESQEIGGTIPSTLANIPVLRIIDFDFNKLTGTIPESIFGIDTLTQLDLNDNQLTGTISNSIGNMVALSFIQLHVNKMTGTVPASMASLAEIKVAEFHENNFSGEMPLCIGVQPKLVAITVDCLEPDVLVTCGDDCGCECL